MLDRVLELPLARERNAPIVVGVRIVRADNKRLPIMIDRLLWRAKTNERVAPVDVRVGVVGIRGECLTE